MNELMVDGYVGYIMGGWMCSGWMDGWMDGMGWDGMDGWKEGWKGRIEGWIGYMVGGWIVA